MKKIGGLFGDFILIVLFVVLGVCGYYIYQNYPREPIAFNNFNLEQNQPIVENSLPSKQFYERMRYSDRIITYHISESCSEQKASSMKEAFDTLEARAVISFQEASKSKAEIKVLCSDVSPQTEEEEGHFVAGEGGPSRVLNSTLYSVILEGKIALYREGQCNNPNVAIHELLHALGFDHNNNPDSILYPTLDCDQEIDSEIISSINAIYSKDSLPDLVFSKANATKSGRYLNFHIEVLNQGLQPSGTIEIGIYADDKFVETFEIGAISIGAKKILDVENLAIPSKAKKIDFVADYENKINELYENNNKISLNLLS